MVTLIPSGTFGLFMKRLCGSGTRKENVEPTGQEHGKQLNVYSTNTAASSKLHIDPASSTV